MKERNLLVKKYTQIILKETDDLYDQNQQGELNEGGLTLLEYNIDLDAKNQITTANQWPMWIMCLPVTVSCMLMAFHALLNALEDTLEMIAVKKGKAVA